jgi:hypothetical protein
MDHSFEPDGGLAPGLGRPDCQRPVKVTRKLHGLILHLLGTQITEPARNAMPSFPAGVNLPALGGDRPIR